MTGVKTARRTGAASPNSTADMPLRSRASALTRVRHVRTRASKPNDRLLRENWIIHGRRGIPRLQGESWRYLDHGVRLLIRNEWNGQYSVYYLNIINHVR